MWWCEDGYVVHLTGATLTWSPPSKGVHRIKPPCALAQLADPRSEQLAHAGAKRNSHHCLRRAMFDNLVAFLARTVLADEAVLEAPACRLSHISDSATVRSTGWV